jgi:hypothetical protein
MRDFVHHPESAMRRILLSATVASLAVLLTPQAYAAGKPGLWSVTTIWQFGMPRVPASLVALAQQQKLKPPVSGQPFIYHICMTPSGLHRPHRQHAPLCHGAGKRLPWPAGRRHAQPDHLAGRWAFRRYVGF